MVGGGGGGWVCAGGGGGGGAVPVAFTTTVLGVFNKCQEAKKRPYLMRENTHQIFQIGYYILDIFYPFS